MGTKADVGSMRRAMIASLMAGAGLLAATESCTDGVSEGPSDSGLGALPDGAPGSSTLDASASPAVAADADVADAAEPEVPPAGATGLVFPSNDTTGSDIRLEWSGANLLPRIGHTAIWKASYAKQAGYYAVTWHTSNDGTWHASRYEFGAHPYPTTGTVDATGQSTGGTGAGGMVQFFEIAGLGAADFIASPGPGPTFPLVTGVWLTQARTSELVNVGGSAYVRHRYWPDVSKPASYIQQDVPETEVLQATAAAVAPAFVIGCSPWTASGGKNSETPSATLRGFSLFRTALAIADIAKEGASEANTPQTAAGLASVWYLNKNPRPSDVADKSGAGHSPVWANGNRPSLFAAP